MLKRGWIREGSDLESELNRFFGDGAFPVATLRSDPLRNLNAGEKAWCFRARQLADSLACVATFEPHRMAAAEKKLRQLAAYPKEAERLAEMLAYYGIMVRGRGASTGCEDRWSCVLDR